jgi:hypothetical protein
VGAWLGTRVSYFCATSGCWAKSEKGSKYCVDCRLFEVIELPAPANQWIAAGWHKCAVVTCHRAAYKGALFCDIHYPKGNPMNTPTAYAPAWTAEDEERFAEMQKRRTAVIEQRTLDLRVAVEQCNIPGKLIGEGSLITSDTPPRAPGATMLTVAGVNALIADALVANAEGVRKALAPYCEMGLVHRAKFPDLSRRNEDRL